MSIRSLVVCVLALAVAGVARAQEVQVNRTNKTIQLTVTGTVRVNAEIAELKAGYRNHASTKDVAYQENVRAAGKIIQELLNAGVPKEAIETETLKLESRTEEEYRSSAPKREELIALQEWTIRVPAGQAQDVADLVVRAGANVLDDVTWTVADPEALDAKANATALAKARELADKMAKQMGAKLGDLLYLSNSAPTARRLLFGSGGGMASMVTTSRVPVLLKLFPEKVERSATVTAVFALE